MVYGHANGRDHAETVDAVGRYLAKGFKAIRVQSGVPGSRQGIRRRQGLGLLRAGAERLAAGRAVGHRALPAPHARAVPQGARGARLRLPSAARRAPSADADRGGSAGQGQSSRIRLFWIEDATPAENQESFRLIRQHTTTPLAVGEVFNSIWDCKDLISEQLIDYIRTTIVHGGGITHVRRIADFAALYQVRTGFHGATDLSPVCMAAAVNFDLWVPNFGIQELMPHADVTDEVFPHNYRFDDGYLVMDEVPGLGVDIDEERAARVPVRARLSAGRAPARRINVELVAGESRC